MGKLETRAGLIAKIAALENELFHTKRDASVSDSSAKQAQQELVKAHKLEEDAERRFQEALQVLQKAIYLLAKFNDPSLLSEMTPLVAVEIGRLQQAVMATRGYKPSITQRELREFSYDFVRLCE